MKRLMTNFVLTVAVLGLVWGCGKKKDDVDDAAMQVREKSQTMMKEKQKGTADLTKAAEEVKDQVEATAGAAQAEVGKTVEDLQSKIDAIVANAKKMIDAKQYQDALTQLQSGLELEGITADQTSTLQGLIERLKKAMGTGAVEDAKTKLGGALKGLGGK